MARGEDAGRAWDPAGYLRFGDERTRPAIDLASRLSIAAPNAVVDLGCGPGNSTDVLRDRWPGASVLGVDSSESMIAAARESRPDGDWEIGEIGRWASDDQRTYDVVFSNAALQWVPEHASLVRRLFARVRLDGALAFQIPSDRYARVREIIDQVAADDAWSERVAPAREALTMGSIDCYYDALADEASAIDAWETTYCHVMDSPEAIVAWISTTGMRPYLDRLETTEEQRRFTHLVTEGVREAYEARADGRVLFPFRRLFVIAYR